MAKSLLLSVDFDETIARIGNFPEILGEVPGAVAALKELSAQGHRIQIWTCRHGAHLEHARAWLDEQGVPYERINENCPALIALWGETRKMSADLYIDDKCLGGLPPWEEVVALVRHRANQKERDELWAQWAATPRIIGISGKRGSGKDTVANLLDKKSPWGFFHKRLFAGTLKKFAQELTGHADMFSQQGKTTFLPEWNMTAGEVLQKLGTDAVRDGLHENAWVLACFAGMRPDEHYLITDCRFPNELEAIRARGGIVIRVEGDPQQQRGDGTRNDEHPSECALDNVQFDYTIHNDSTLEALEQKVQDMVNNLLSQAA